jgi:hypothetical protein
MAADALSTYERERERERERGRGGEIHKMGM